MGGWNLLHDCGCFGDNNLVLLKVYGVADRVKCGQPKGVLAILCQGYLHGFPVFELESSRGPSAIRMLDLELCAMRSFSLSIRII